MLHGKGTRGNHVGITRSGENRDERWWDDLVGLCVIRMCCIGMRTVCNYYLVYVFLYVPISFFGMPKIL